jgi:hypothetical protein
MLGLPSGMPRPLIGLLDGVADDFPKPAGVGPVFCQSADDEFTPSRDTHVGVEVEAGRRQCLIEILLQPRGLGVGNRMRDRQRVGLTIPRNLGLDPVDASLVHCAECETGTGQTPHGGVMVRRMWPSYAAGALAAAALGIGALLAYLGIRKGAIGAAIVCGALAVVGVAAYAITDARYQSCVDDGGIAESSNFAVEGRHWCYRRVLGPIRGSTVAVRDTRSAFERKLDAALGDNP